MAAKKQDVDPAESDEDVYTKEGLDELQEGDELMPSEEGFMEGEISDAEQGICSNCKKVLEDNVVEREIRGETYRFCSLTCAEHYTSEQQNREKPAKPLRIGEKRE